MTNAQVAAHFAALPSNAIAIITVVDVDDGWLINCGQFTIATKENLADFAPWDDNDPVIGNPAIFLEGGVTKSIY